MDNLLQRLAGGPSNLQQNDYNDWNQMVGAAPKDQFGRAAYSAIQQVDPQEYADHITPGVGGTDPLGMLNQGQRSGLASTILGELTRRGMGHQDVAQAAGLGSLNPNNMSPTDLAGLLQYTQQNQPKVYGRVAAQYQDQPDMLHSLLGNKALMGLVTGIGGSLLMNQVNKRR